MARPAALGFGMARRGLTEGVLEYALSKHLQVEERCRVRLNRGR